MRTMQVSPRQKYIAEFIGTFFLVFAGTGAIIVNDVSGGAISHLGIALAFGLAVAIMIYTFGEVSGAHLNPAVSYAFWLAGRFPAQQLLPYVLSQCSGALCASLVLHGLFPEHTTLGATLPAGVWYQSFILEILLAFFLMLVILVLSSGSRESGMMAGLAIGGLVGLEALFAGKICGASMNPARSLAPALVSGHWQYLWIYLVAPFAGMHGAVLCCRVMKLQDCCGDQCS
jgi:aquaporin NIP